MEIKSICAVVGVIYLLYGCGYGLAKANKLYQMVLITLFWPFFKGLEDGGGFG